MTTDGFVLLAMQQHWRVPYLMSILLAKLGVEGIFEVGTGQGGLGYIFASHAKEYKTVDNRDIRQKPTAINPCFILADEKGETVSELIKEMRRPMALVCDGGDKVWEVQNLTQHLKPGDYLLVHDFGPCPYWDWVECTAKDIPVGFRMVPEEIMDYGWGVYAK